MVSGPLLPSSVHLKRERRLYSLQTESCRPDLHIDRHRDSFFDFDSEKLILPQLTQNRENSTMDQRHHPQQLLLLVSTAGDPAVKVDIINGLSGYEFSRLRLTASVGSTVVWTNRTAVIQVVQLNDRVIRLAPGGNDGATALTRFSESGQILGRLRSNRAASITFFITEEFKL